MKRVWLIQLIIFIFELSGCSQNDTNKFRDNENLDMTKEYETAVLGAGCFWCVEAVFQSLKGVEKVEAGYSGGTSKNPTYEEVCTGTTGHAEVARITFDPEVISFEQILEVFWHTHDPTTLNRQGADIGTQYRSAIFYVNDDQKRIAEESKKKTEASGLWDAPIVTEITPLTEFYVAEDYHQNYYTNNPNKPYCSAVIAPKLKKFYKEYQHLLKK
jgi:peptide-methionine (S)-S-oxide reductase